MKPLSILKLQCFLSPVEVNCLRWLVHLVLHCTDEAQLGRNSCLQFALKALQPLLFYAVKKYVSKAHKQVEIQTMSEIVSTCYHYITYRIYLNISRTPNSSHMQRVLKEIRAALKQQPHINITSQSGCDRIAKRHLVCSPRVEKRPLPVSEPIAYTANQLFAAREWQPLAVTVVLGGA